jgi:hypothetical protein
MIDEIDERNHLSKRIKDGIQHDSINFQFSKGSFVRLRF